jgi:hypothetical protein
MLLSVVAAGVLAACGGDGDDGGGATTNNQLTFRGGTDFAGAHDGDPLRAALIRISDNAVLDRQATTVTAASPNNFSVTFAPTNLDSTVAYRVHYWIDSNLGGAGTLGTCDAPANDHQWSVDIPVGTFVFTDPHRPTATQNVCATFPATATNQLTFRGDGTFGGAHANQPLRAALIRVSDNAVLDRQTTTVAAAAPNFSVTFAPTNLDAAAAYRVHYWIDSNLGGAGTLGTCDAPANDHQWSVDIPVGTFLVTDTHRPASTQNVCPTFVP